MKRYFSLLLLICLIICTSCSCSIFEKDSSAENVPEAEEQSDVGDGFSIEDEDEEYSGISFEEEADEYVLQKKHSKASDFVGTWVSTSDKSTYLYGNVELKINKNGSWTGNITEEKLKGTWKFNKDTMHMKDVVLEFEFDLAFNKDGNLIMVESAEDGNINTVLTRK